MRVPGNPRYIFVSCGRIRALGSALATKSILCRTVRKRLFLIDFNAPQCHPYCTAAAFVGAEGSMSIEHFR